MDMEERKDLKELIEYRDLCVSIFMPTHRMGAETRQDPIRLKNALAQAESKLEELGQRAPEARAFLEPAYRLLDSPGFWRHQSDGLAIFLSKTLFRSYRLPAPFDELLGVTGRFHVKPLIALLAADGLFYILALSQNGVRLLQASRHDMMAIELEEMPRGIADALKYDVYEQSLQFHTRTAAPAAAGRRAAMFHGQGGGTDDAKDRILRYFRQADQGLRELLRGEQAPLVLAGVEYLIPLYLKASTYAHTLGERIPGSPEGLSDRELHDRAWQIVEPLFLESQRKDFSRYLDLSDGPRASRDIGAIVPASREGESRPSSSPGASGSGTPCRATERRSSWPTNRGQAWRISRTWLPPDPHEWWNVHVLDPEALQGQGPVAAIFRY